MRQRGRKRESVAENKELTGDDDSVAHAWSTEPVSVIVDIDRGIAPLVRVFNKIPGVRTFASCEGHPHSKEMTAAYLMLYMTPESIVPLAKELERFLAMSETPNTAAACAYCEWTGSDLVAYDRHMFLQHPDKQQRQAETPEQVAEPLERQAMSFLSERYVEQFGDESLIRSKSEKISPRLLLEWLIKFAGEYSAPLTKRIAELEVQLKQRDDDDRVVTDFNNDMIEKYERDLAAERKRSAALEEHIIALFDAKPSGAKP
jgi:hypothetical protein